MRANAPKRPMMTQIMGSFPCLAREASAGQSREGRRRGGTGHLRRRLTAWILPLSTALFAFSPITAVESRMAPIRERVGRRVSPGHVRPARLDLPCGSDLQRLPRLEVQPFH